ncbi:MAG: D-alanyl-D-alanine carboxypeptidase/D-alanyl-D-alanine-endopeptidase [Deltaproteobacteria bacterium CG_4_9_14_3_um_filter_63_12]|nr:MAG: D-alanyl-D-alanine carboxypeptidase/D-alanyl-D-alanine-endopeptidase [Deltaproteobacteria bacterium CG_4_9_14_3_um_filter_63_12]
MHGGPPRFLPSDLTRPMTRRFFDANSLCKTVLLALAVMLSCGADPSASSVHRSQPLNAEARSEAERLSPSTLGGATRGFTDASVRADFVLPEPATVSAEKLKELADTIAVIRQRPALSKHQLSALVVDLDTGQVLYESDSTRPQKPASNTKMFTTAAALELLGPDHTLSTKVYLTGTPTDKGTLEGDLIVVGDQDPSVSEHFYNPPEIPYQTLAKAVSAKGAVHFKGSLVMAGDFLFKGFRYDTLDVEKHRKAAGDAFKAALNGVGISIKERKDVPTIELPPEAELVAEWRSPPVSTIVTVTNQLSHNEFADNLSRHLGLIIGGESSFAAGTKVVKDWLLAAGVDTEGLVLNDGSGLSHDNRATAAQFVALIRYMESRPTAELWRHSMSVAGENGTFVARMKGDDTRGRVFAKSGTLDGTLATSGVLLSKHGNHRIAFSLLLDQVKSRKLGRTALDDMVQAFAGDLLQQGSPPEAPVLRMVRNVAGGLEVSWSAVEGADGYRVWLSDDGATWSPQVARGCTAERLKLRDVPAGKKVYIRVSAVSKSGESTPSDVYGAAVGEGAARLLLVDGDDRWQDEPAKENAMGAAHAFMAEYGQAIDGVAFDTCANEETAASLPLSGYPLVIWALGEEAGESKALTALERDTLEGYLKQGGALWITGSELGFDLLTEGDDGKRFLEEVLKVRFASDDACTLVARANGGAFGGSNLIGFNTPGFMDITTPDVLSPVNGARSNLAYEGGTSGSAGIEYDGDYKLLVWGFPFESIDSGARRNEVMVQGLKFFGMLP